MTLRRLTPLFGLLLAACALLAIHALRPIVAGPSDKPRQPVASPRIEPAKNPIRLLLHDDGRKIVGWVSGTRDLAGQVVEITLSDERRVRKVKLGKDNTFTWPYTVAGATKVQFKTKVRAANDKLLSLEDSLTVSPLPAEQTPSVFFVVDRTAYRPTQTLHFAGFLRKMNAKGEFEPLPKREVEVELVSEKKRTHAFKMKTTSDDFGRITGAYTFQHDALDHYTLAVPGFKGSARVMLGEYRKSKIKLDIKGEVKSNKLELTFAVLDFLEKPVEGTKASFTAQVVRRDGKSKQTTLKAEDFVYHSPLSRLFGVWENLSEEQLLLWQANGPSAAALFSPSGTAVVGQVSGDVAMTGKKAGRYSIDLQKEWLAGNHSIVVSGVVTDTNGREQRATRTIPIGDAKCPGVTLELTQTTIVAGDRVQVRAKRAGKEAKEHAYDGALSLVVMKLSPGSPAVPAYDYGWGTYYGNFSYRAHSYYRRPLWGDIPQAEAVKRTMVTAVSFSKSDTASVKLTDPGAYKLVAIGQREDGTTVRTEVGCVVRAPKGLPALTLHLDKDEFATGEVLTGIIRSTHGGARILLTLRDASGLRLVKPLTLGKDGTLRLEETIPAGVGYGCRVEVQYPDESNKLAVADTFVRILPRDRMLTITPTVKPTVAPSEMVKVDLKVDRQEEVDLIVSVYDQSLLGIAPDRFVDVKNFYLADERARAASNRDALRRRIGNVTIEALAKKAEAMLKADKKLAQLPEGQSLQRLINTVRNRAINSIDLATALRLVDVEVLLHPGTTYYYGYRWQFQHQDQAEKEHRVIDLLDHKYHNWSLVPHLINDVVILTETHPSYANRLLLGRAFNPYYGNFYGAYRGYGQQQQLNLRRNFDFSASANAVHSAEGQAFLSHLPVGGAQSPVLINTDAGEAHIGVRRDFSDSAYWNALVRTDKEGKASVSFKLPDSLTNWQVVVTGVSRKMHVGQAKTSFRSFKPIMVWPMLPRVFTEGDRVELFASVHNRTDKTQRIKVKLKAENGEVLTVPEKEVVVPAKANVPVYWTFKALSPGFTQLLMTADCAAGNDASLKRLPVTRAAAEQVVTAAGMVKDSATFTVPRGVDLKAASLEVSFAPSLAADMADTLNYLVEYPYGCVEQTMSRFLPAIKVAQVLQDFRIEHPELQKKLPNCVLGGIKRLLELQQADGGWGWHGNGQTHEMMTPYALYGLLQAEKAGYAIPAGGSIERGLNRLKQFIDAMKENQTADRIYCIHVYAHRRDVEQPWWDFIAAQLKADKLSDQALALALETAVQKGKKDLAKDLATALRGKVKKVRGHRFWETAGFSRWGDDKFEVTAAAMKALVAFDKDDPLIDGILGFFAATKRGDRWNSTKDTAMILYAMCDYLAKQKFDPKARPELNFSLNAGALRKVAFDKKLTRKVVLPGTTAKEGVNKLSFQTTSTGMMYRVVFRYWKTGADVKPADEGITVIRNFYLLDGKGGVVRQLKNGDKVPRGSYVLSEVMANDRLKSDMRYVLVENPKPACAEIIPVEDARFANNQHSTAYALREEREAGVVFHHEQTSWQINDRCVLLLELAGEYIVPPARVEMMYRTEHRGHSGTFLLKVADEKK
jgi:uncharacterized protein YfaS (alpha-2-macroglobulin family)